MKTTAALEPDISIVYAADWTQRPSTPRDAIEEKVRCFNWPDAWATRPQKCCPGSWNRNGTHGRDVGRYQPLGNERTVSSFPLASSAWGVIPVRRCYHAA